MLEDYGKKEYMSEQSIDGVRQYFFILEWECNPLRATIRRTNVSWNQIGCISAEMNVKKKAI